MSSSLIWQPTDIVHYLITYLDQTTTIQLWQTNKRFKWIVGEWVPLTFSIVDINKGLNLVSLFKKVLLKTIYRHTLDDSSCIQLGKHLTTLDLRYNSTISDNGLEHLPHLTILNLLCNSTITDKGLEHLPHLTALHLWSNNTITDKGLEHLPNLTTIYLGSNITITDKGLEHLPYLTNLALWPNTTITDKGLEHLPYLANLVLGSNTNITQECRQKLAARGVKINS